MIRAAVIADPGVSDTMEGRGTPPPDWVGETVVPLTASMALDSRSPFGSTAQQTLRITGLTITKTGSGECSIDRIVIDQVAFTEEPQPGC